MAARKCRIIFLVITLIVNALDFISDWLFYVSAEKVEKGLVYGPVDSIQVMALLIFSVIGSVGFVVEIALFVFELRKEDHHGDLLLDLVSAVIIWIEDIPQVIISFSIALCREEAISIFQLTKAGLVLIGVIISIVATIIRFCRKYESKGAVCWVRMCLIAGIFVEGAFAVAIFYFTHTEPGTNGDVSFRVPTNVLDEHLSDHKYLTDVNLFVHHSDMFDAWNLDTNKKDSTANWLRLFQLNNLKEKQNFSFKLNYEHVDIKILNLAIWIAAGVSTTSNTKWTLSECYSLNQDTAVVIPLSNTTCTNNEFSSSRSDTFFINFRFDAPETGLIYRRRIFGEVYFNMKVLKSGICSDGNFEDPFRNGATLYYPLTFHYFRVNFIKNSSNEESHLYRDSSNVTRFYSKNSMEITDVADLWRTGWKGCTSTGSMSPVMDKNMKVECF